MLYDCIHADVSVSGSLTDAAGSCTIKLQGIIEPVPNDIDVLCYTVKAEFLLTLKDVNGADLAVYNLKNQVADDMMTFPGDGKLPLQRFYLPTTRYHCALQLVKPLVVVAPASPTCTSSTTVDQAADKKDCT
jgi:hypothetical protein